MVTLLKVGKISVELHWGNGQWGHPDFFLRYPRSRIFWIGGIRIAY